MLAAFLALFLLADQLFPPSLPGSSNPAHLAPHAQVVLARDGTPLRAFPDRAHIWRHPVRVAEVSPRYVEAVLAYEDRFFYWHPGEYSGTDHVFRACSLLCDTYVLQ